MSLTTKSKQNIINNLWTTGVFNFRPLSINFSLFILLVSYIQLIELSMIISRILLSIHDESIEPATPLSLYFVGITQKSILEFDAFSVFRVAITSIVGLIYFGFVLIILLSLVRKKRMYEWFIRFMQPIGYLGIFFFAFPVFNTFLKLFIECITTKSETILVRGILGSFIGTIVMPLQNLGYISFNVPLKTKNPFSRLDNNFLITYQAHKYCLSLIITAAIRTEIPSISSSLSGPLAIINLIFALAENYFLMERSSFIYTKVFNLAIILQSIVTALAFSTILTWFFQMNLNIFSSNMIFLAFLLFAPIYGININWKNRNLNADFQNLPKKKLDNWDLINMINRLKPKEGISKSIFFVQDFREYFNDFIFLSKNDPIAHLKSIGNTRSQLSAKLIAGSILFEEYKDYYTAFIFANEVKTSPKSSFGLQIGATCLQFYIQASLFDTLGQKSERLMIYQYLRYIKRHQELVSAISASIDANIDFYKLIEEPSPCLFNMMTKSKQIQSSIKNVETIWKRIPEDVIRGSPKLMREYGLFYCALKINLPIATSLLKMHNRVLLQRIDESSVATLLEKWLHNKYTICIHSSLEPSSYGKILKASQSVEDVLGYLQEDLQGKQLQLIFPTVIAEAFTKLLKSNIESSGKFDSVISHETFLLTRDNFMIPATCYTMASPFLEQGLHIGTIFTLKHTFKEHILLDKNGRVVGLSERIYNLLKTEHESAHEKVQKVVAKAKVIGHFGALKKAGAKRIDDNSSKKMLVINEGQLEKRLPKYKFNQLILAIGDTELNVYEAEKRNPDEEKEVHIPSFTGIRNQKKRDSDNRSVQFSRHGAKRASMSIEGSTSSSPYKQYYEDRQKIDQKKATKSRFQRVVSKEQIKVESSKEYEIEISHDPDAVNIYTIISKRSDGSSGNISTHFRELVAELSIFKFKSGKVLHWAYCIFLFMFVASILFTYLSGTALTSDISNRTDLFVTLSQRDKHIMEVARSVSYDYYLKTYYYDRPTYAHYAKYNENRSREVRIDLSEENRECIDILQSLNDQTLINILNSQSMKLYNSNFDLIPNSEDYSMQNSFKYTDYILSFFGLFIERINQTTARTRRYRRYLMGNIYNSFLIDAEPFPDIIVENIKISMDNNSESTNIIYGIVFTFYFVYLFLLIIIMVYYTIDTGNFFEMFASSDANVIENRIKSLEIFKFNREFKSSIEDIYSEEFKRGKESKLISKNCTKKKLKREIILKKTLPMIVVFIPVIIILSLSYVYPFQLADIINTELANMKKIDSISRESLAIIHEFINTDVFERDFIFKNQNVTDRIDDDIAKLGSIVSSSEGLSNKVNEMLAENLCPYYRDPETKCELQAQGVLLRGLRSTVLYLQNQMRVERDIAKSMVYNFEVAKNFTLLQSRADMYRIGSDGLSPTTSIFIRRLRNDLIDSLTAQTSSIITLFVFGMVFSTFGILFMTVHVNIVLKNDRTCVANTMIVVPMEFILANRHFKMYLIKENREFLKLFKLKSYEQKAKE